MLETDTGTLMSIAGSFLVMNWEEVWGTGGLDREFYVTVPWKEHIFKLVYFKFCLVF